MPTNAPPEESKPKWLKDRPEVKKLARQLDKKPQSLQDYFAVGQQLHPLSQDQTVAVRGSNWREGLAEHLGCSEGTLNKCLQFFQAYQDGDLAELEELEVGWGQLTDALGIKNKQKRHSLIRKAKKERWSNHELKQEVHKLKGSRRGGGRPRREVRSSGCLADVVELARLAKPVNEFLGTIWLSNQKTYTRELVKMDEQTQESVRKHLDNATEQLKLLQKQCKEGLAVLTALLGKINVPGQQ